MVAIVVGPLLVIEVVKVEVVNLCGVKNSFVVVAVTTVVDVVEGVKVEDVNDSVNRCGVVNGFMVVIKITEVDEDAVVDVVVIVVMVVTVVDIGEVDVIDEVNAVGVTHNRETFNEIHQ